MKLGLDTCSFKDKTAAKTEKIAQEVEKLQRIQSSRGRGEAQSCVPDNTAVLPPPRAIVNTTGSPLW